jgi:hypothetical protein
VNPELWFVYRRVARTIDSERFRKRPKGKSTHLKIKRLLLVFTAAVALTGGFAAPAVADPTYITDGSAAPFDRDAAVRWALDNAAKEQPFPAACTWFVSNTMWAGGMQADADWTPQGEHGRVQKRPGTVSATAAQPLLDYLLARYPLTQHISMNFSTNAVPEAQPGDIVAYDWENDGNVDHLALVVAIAPGAYPEVAEWGVGAQSGSGYTKRGWTYSQLNHRWLQHGYPSVTATLFHIDTRNVTTY